MPKLPTGFDDYGAYWRVQLRDASKAVNFIVHKGDEKDTNEDRSFLPTEKPSVWLQSGDSTVYATRGDAEDYALIHYRRPDGDYGDPTSPDFTNFWGLHVWEGSAETGVTWQTPLREVGRDAYGQVFKIRLVDDAPALAFIVHRGDNKDPAPDQLLDLNAVGHEVWLLSGYVDADQRWKYLLPMLGGPGVDADLAKAKAHWLTEDTIAWNADPVPGGSYALHYSPDGGLAAGPVGVTGGETIPLRRARELSAELKAKWPHLAGYHAYRIAPEDLARVPAALRGQLAVSASDENGFLRAATGVQIPGVLDDLYANDAALGPTFSGRTPTLRLWAPTAQDVMLRLGDAVVPMSRDDANGVWSVTGTPAWYGAAYAYEVKVYAPSTGQVETNLVTDPYSVALTANSSRSVLLDLADPALTPLGWRLTPKPQLRAPEDIALYELHVRDFSTNDATVPPGQRGTYLAFTQPLSDGMRHLRGLAEAGLTHVHLLPAFDIATIDEVRANHQQPACDLASFPPASDEQQKCVMAVADTDGFNWGYDPWHYTVPEGSYATDPDGGARTLQFRKMVQALNLTGLRVVMDVVYNHTNASGQAAKSVLDRIVPGYYHRLNAEGAVETSTCCQNTATEHAMMEKLMVDSVVTWARDYGVDGFRFDLMGHHSKSNMLAVRAALDALTPARDGVDGKKVYLYGEGWNFGEVANGARFEQATQANMAGTGIGTFNDRLRDAVRGGGPFDGDPGIQGFGSGLYYDANGNPINGTPEQQKAKLLLHQDQIKVGLTGNLEDYRFVDRFGNTATGADVDYNGSPAGYNADPEEAITYVEAHDNETLFDAYAAKLPTATSRHQRARAQLVALSTVTLGQGIPFFHAGSDLLRSKSMDKNSFNSGDWFNRLFWDYSQNGFGAGLPPAADNGSRYPYLTPLLANPLIKPTPAEIEWTAERVRELLEIRRSSRLFRIGDAAEIQRRLSFANGGPAQVPGLIVMKLSDEVAPDLDRDAESIVVFFNATPETKTWTETALRGHHYQLHKVQRTSEDELTTEAQFVPGQGRFRIPPRTTAVFVEG
jgi:pullulanase-type alpha-1,6-glucosidase